MNRLLVAAIGRVGHKHGRLIDLLSGNIQLHSLVTLYTCLILILKRNAAL